MNYRFVSNDQKAKLEILGEIKNTLAEIRLNADVRKKELL